MELRDAEHGHHRVADELLDRAAVALDHGLHLLEVAGHHAPEALGVEALGQAGETGDVGEDDRDRLADRPVGRLVGQEGAAAGAEPRADGLLRPAGRARHGGRGCSPCRVTDRPRDGCYTRARRRAGGAAVR